MQGEGNRGIITLFQITHHIWQGPFASRRRLDDLRRNGITHIVNVGESPNQLVEPDGPFTRIVWHPIEDLVRIPAAAAIECVDAIHGCVCEADANVYVHCVAGWNRSPTVLWLYLIGCGLNLDATKVMITAASYDAVPAHPKLVDDALVRRVREHGRNHLTPHPRPQALVAKNVAEQRDKPSVSNRQIGK